MLGVRALQIIINTALKIAQKKQNKLTVYVLNAKKNYTEKS